MKVLVISLPASNERRASATMQLDSLSIHFEFFDAVDGRTSGNPLLARYDERNFLINYGRPANPGELGCYASHFLAWQRCVELGEAILVLEDDFLLTEGFPESLSLCEQLIGQVGYIRLEKTTRARSMKVRKLGDFTLRKYIKAPQGALCYGIAPFVAKSFIAHSREFVYPVDVFVRHFWLHRNPLFGLTPYTATQSDLAQDSIIGVRRKGRKPIRIMIHRFLLKVYRVLMFGKENLRYLLKPKKIKRGSLDATP